MIRLGGRGGGPTSKQLMQRRVADWLDQAVGIHARVDAYDAPPHTQNTTPIPSAHAPAHEYELFAACRWRR